MRKQLLCRGEERAYLLWSFSPVIQPIRQTDTDCRTRDHFLGAIKQRKAKPKVKLTQCVSSRGRVFSRWTADLRLVFFSDVETRTSLSQSAHHSRKSIIYRYFLLQHLFASQLIAAHDALYLSDLLHAASNSFRFYRVSGKQRADTSDKTECLRVRGPRRKGIRGRASSSRLRGDVQTVN